MKCGLSRHLQLVLLAEAARIAIVSSGLCFTSLSALELLAFLSIGIFRPHISSTLPRLGSLFLVIYSALDLLHFISCVHFLLSTSRLPRLSWSDVGFPRLFIAPVSFSSPHFSISTNFQRIRVSIGLTAFIPILSTFSIASILFPLKFLPSFPSRLISTSFYFLLQLF